MKIGNVHYELWMNGLETTWKEIESCSMSKEEIKELKKEIKNCVPGTIFYVYNGYIEVHTW